MLLCVATTRALGDCTVLWARGHQCQSICSFPLAFAWSFGPWAALASGYGGAGREDAALGHLRVWVGGV